MGNPLGGCSISSTLVRVLGTELLVELLLVVAVPGCQVEGRDTSYRYKAYEFGVEIVEFVSVSCICLSWFTVS